MNATEIFRRGIVLPLTAEAMKQMKLDNIEDPSAFAAVMFDDDGQFYRVWNTQLFHQINWECGTIIDDYESEELRSGIDAVPRLIDGVLNARNLIPGDRVLLLQFRKLAVEAASKQTSLFFIF